MTNDQLLLSLVKREKLLGTDDKQADKMEKQILTALKTYFESYECDLVLETLTKLGQSPNLIYDDNGKFAVSSEGMQPVVTNDEQLVGQVYIMTEKDQWFPTIREALWHYITAL